MHCRKSSGHVHPPPLLFERIVGHLNYLNLSCTDVLLVKACVVPFPPASLHSPSSYICRRCCCFSHFSSLRHPDISPLTSAAPLIPITFLALFRQSGLPLPSFKLCKRLSSQSQEFELNSPLSPNVVLHKSPQLHFRESPLRKSSQRIRRLD